ncbi:carbamate kinase [Bacillus horti]|uniref:Carbamate kinase n=1 Tax=Caldalkalibacillus horti TaxID=77523 RepID=A0ABT9W3B9_9BACI|nr:carbamate kinase [Bacillus horti]MDQ0167738.1 carbamate kinase [Bacillus horti]
MSKIMLALGGNALGESAEEQKKLVGETAYSIVDLIEQGHQVVIAHGNGPQVGKIHSALELAAELENSDGMPLPECGAMSQGYIGYHLQNAIREELLNRQIKRPVSAVVTQVVVDLHDPAFKNPSKPIGRFYTEEQAKRLASEKGYEMMEDSGRGWRRIVPSPKPQKIVEKDTIKTLLDADGIVISVGGGGIPVIEEANKLTGVNAVIDKDFASSKLAQELELDYLFLLTSVECVSINFGKPNEQQLNKISLSEAIEYIRDGQFGAGSMLPKVEAAIEFVQSKPGRKAIIASIEKTKEAILGESGTTFYSDK